MYDIIMCKRCDKMFKQKMNKEVCMECLKKEEELFIKVSRFMRKRQNRSATIDEIEENTGVSKDYIYRWVKEKRLQPSVYKNLHYPCEKCKKPTTHGLICVSCSNELKEDLLFFEKEKEFAKNKENGNRRTYLSEK